MAQALAIINFDQMAADLRCLMWRQRDGDVVCRVSALALVLEGKSRAEATALSGMQRQILRDWVRRYNAEGVSGLTSREASVRRPELSEAPMQELKALVIKGPDRETDKVVRWRCIDLKALAAPRFSAGVHERTIGKWL
ncbi:MAG: hypothetical protein B7Z58_16180 [Acidiphilium sp. 37-64-53]|uniref:helix-turn-helix domain-containing protein n=1 Tax=unclassified Acidiphilium TaxID=2617493 RepID=UPI000BD11913|nr:MULTISPECIES: helix-turn-helix domain-containing protein [unclassified Acidiphilium]OYW00254.1 MAG: hypothetical protein B7Z58_16180 [Acidiphilium sp. 37-64-53]